MMVIGVILFVVGVLLITKTYGLVDIGLILAVFGIFAFAIGVSSTVSASGGYPIAGITETMTRATTQVVDVKESKVEEVEIPKVDREDVDLLARLITAEVGYSQNYDPLDYEEMCYLTGSVVINRINHEDYPDTLEEVIYDDGQYQCTWNGHINRAYDDVAYEIAEELLAYGTTIDSDVVFQAEFSQGSGVYKQIKNMRFCYR